MSKDYIPSLKDAERVKTCVRAGIIDVERISKIIRISKKDIETNYPYELGFTDDEELGIVASVAFDMAASGKFPHMTQYWLKVKGGAKWRDNIDEVQQSSGSPIVIVLKGDQAQRA